MTHSTRFWLRAALAALLWIALAASAEAASVTMLDGDVEAGRGEPPRWQPIAEGEELEPGDRVRTGADGRAEIRLGRAVIRLYPNSLLRVPDDTGDEAVDLETGTSLFDISPGTGPFEVRTPEVVVSVKGTRFSVALAGAQAAVAVFRGAVGVKSLSLEAAREVLVREGFVATGGEQVDLDVLYGVDPWEAFLGDAPPSVPTPDPAPVPASRAALDGAREAAITVSRPNAVATAARRHANVRERVDLIQRRRAAAERAEDLGERAQEVRAAALRDAVADARPALADAIEEKFVEAWLNGGAPAGGGSTSPFAVTYLPGMNEVLLESSSGGIWQLTSDQVAQVLDGSQSLPQTLEAELANQGIVDPQQVAQQLMVLLSP